MKIAITNKRYFESGGPERYLFEITEVLQANGNDIYPFAVRRKWNKEALTEKYFVSPPAGEDVLYYKDYNLNLFQKLRLFANAVYSFEAKQKMERLINEYDIDLLYILAIANDISPSIIDSAKRKNIPVVLRASDFYLFCAMYLFLRERKVCRECEIYGYKRALKYRCVKGSLAATGVRVCSMYIHKWFRIYDKVDAFVTPSLYMRDAFLKAGYPEKKIHHIPSFLNTQSLKPCFSNDGYLLYFGRVDSDKGVLNLIKSYELGKFRMPLYIVGPSSEGEDKRLNEYVQDRNIKNIKFLGFKKRHEMIDLIQRSMFTIAPSIVPDNSPMSVLESMGCGKPVIGSDLGGISEQITPECGILVPPDDPAALASAIDSLLSDTQKVVEMGREGVNRVKTEYSIEKHYSRLLNIFNRLLKK